MTVTHRFSHTVFDHGFSFLWAAVLIGVLIRYVNKPRLSRRSLPRYFFLETAAIAALFYFCSNLNYLKTVGIPIIGIGSKSTQGIFTGLYLAGVTGLFGLYLLCLYWLRPLYRRLPFLSTPAVPALLFVFVVVFLFSVYGLRKNTAGSTWQSAAGQEQGDGKISPPVILIVLDTLRADRLSMYGGPETVSPQLSAFAEDALVFERCIAPSSWTLPSHASLFTGVYPLEHMCIFKDARLPDDFKTLAELFKENGYRTAAIVSNYGWLNKRFNLHQGFDVYDCRPSIGKQQGMVFRPILLTFAYLTGLYPKCLVSYRTADDVSRDALFLAERMAGRPFFLFLNYMDAHSPYFPPRFFSRRFSDSAFPQVNRLVQYGARITDSYDKPTWNRFLLSQYDAEVAILDNELGNLFDRLKNMGLYDTALIVVTADHGELFGKNGFYEHHHCPMYEGLVRVPLIVKFPLSARTGREKNIINLTDAYATIASICGLKVPEDISGRAYGSGAASGVAEFFSFNEKMGEHRVLYDANYKFFEYYGPQNPDKLRKPELYDLAADPHETRNLYSSRPAIIETMGKKLQTWKAAHQRKFPEPAKTADPISREMTDNLKALGYVD